MLRFGGLKSKAVAALARVVEIDELERRLTALEAKDES